MENEIRPYVKVQRVLNKKDNYSILCVPCGFRTDDFPYIERQDNKEFERAIEKMAKHLWKELLKIKSAEFNNYTSVSTMIVKKIVIEQICKLQEKEK
jgi:hypothetical protein